MANSTEITIISNGSAWSDELPSIDISGTFKDATGNPVDFESLTIGDVVLEPAFPTSNPNVDVTGRFSYHFNKLQEDNETFLNMSSIFDNGNEVVIAAQSSQLGEFSTAMRFPLRMKMELNENESYRNDPFVIDFSDDLIVTWNADNSSLKSSNSVGVAVVYNAGFSQLDDPQMPVSLPIFSEIVADNGRLVIPASALAHYPNGSKVTVVVARGDFHNYTIVGTGSNVVINGVTYETSKLLTVIK